MSSSPVFGKSGGPRRPRRSLSLRTPGQKKVDVIDSSFNETLDGSPIVDLLTGDNRNCSTPVNSRKRNFLFEESPANQALNDSEYLSPSPAYTISQELRRVGVDVGWQWNSPKSKAEADKQPKHLRKRRKSLSCRDKLNKILTEKNKCLTTNDNKATGFYKIKEELLKAKKNTENTFMKLLEEEDPNIVLTRKLSDEFLNDSDDENLIIISQEIEAGLKPTTITKLKEQESLFTNDSFDQYMLDMPFDELINQKMDKNKHNESSSSINKSFSRHSSMPGSKVVEKKAGKGENSRAISRHESMPPSSTNSVKSKPDCGTQFSSNESISSSICSSNGKPICSEEEIARKRRIALERLRSTQQKKSQTKAQKS